MKALEVTQIAPIRREENSETDDSIILNSWPELYQCLPKEKRETFKKYYENEEEKP